MPTDLEDVDHGVEGADEAARREAPQSDRLVFASGHDELVVRRDGAAPHLVLVTLCISWGAEVFVYSRARARVCVCVCVCECV